MVHCTSGAGCRMEATRGQRIHGPRSLHLNIGQLSRRELSLYANSDFCVMRSVVSQSGDGEMVWRGRTLPTHSWTLGHQSDTDRLHLAVVGRELGAGQLRGAVTAVQWYTDTAATFYREFPCFREAGPSPRCCFVIVFVLPETGSRPHPISEITGTRRRRWQRGADGKLIPGWGNNTTTSTGTQTSPAATQSSTQVMLSTDWYLHK